MHKELQIVDMSKLSDDYHDYVFRDGKVLGKFDEMYTNSKDVPWHQDIASQRVVVDIDIAILNHFLQSENISSVCDVGCGLGYVTARLYSEFSVNKEDLSVVGLDISIVAATRAKEKFPKITFYGLNILKDDYSHLKEKFDLIYMKDVIWYVYEDIEFFISCISDLLKPNGIIYVMQSVPSREEFVGSEIFPTTRSISQFLNNYFSPIYVSSTYEINLEDLEVNHNQDKYIRFLGKIK